jgi:carboxymethylenebutenolidase
VANPDFSAMLRDAQAAIDELKKEGPVGIIGFCLGGTLAFLAATEASGLSAAVCYYGGHIIKIVDKMPKCPTQMHFGDKDASIPMNDVETIKKKHPECEIYVYADAGHGFNCDERGSYNADAAKLAWQRSMEFLNKHIRK